MGLRLGTSTIAPDVARVTRLSSGRNAVAAGSSSMGTAAPPADDILISGAANVLNQISAAHTSKLARVAAAVQGGGYQVDAGATSRAIVEQALVWGGLT